IPGPEIGDYLGLPINEAARLHGDSWDASLLTLPEHQCKPHPSDYSPRGPANLRLWKEVDTPTQQVKAWHTHISWQAPERTIWMDGRPHPPEYARHTWMGFSTGKWEGDMLTVTTTHLKKSYIQRNGVDSSDQATMVEHFFRSGENGQYLTLISIVTDPIYLAEPLVRTTDWMLALNQGVNTGGRGGGGDCGPAETVDEVAGQPKDYVPHFLPGTNDDQLHEVAKKYGIPFEATQG